MITPVSLVILLSTSSALLDTESDRVAYNNCLVDFVVTNLDAKIGLNDFRSAAKDACAAERGSYVASIKKDELEFGSTDQEATDYAEEEAGNVLFSFIDSYTGYLNSNSRPVKE